MSMNNNEINVNENNTEAAESIISKMSDKVTQTIQNHKVKKAIKTGKISSGKDGLDAALSKATSTSRVLQSKRNKFIDHINDKLSNVNNLENRLEDIKNAEGHKDKNFGKICDKIQGKISKLASICKNTINATKRLDQDDTTIESLTMKVTVFNSQFNKLYDEIDTMLDNLAANLKKNGKVKNDTLAKRNATPDLKENASATKEYRDAARGVKSAKNEADVADIKEDTTAKAKKIQAKVDGKDAILAAEKGSFAGTVEEIKDLKEEIADLKKESSEKISELEEKVDNAKSDDERTRLQKRLDSLTSRYDKEVKESMDKLAAEEKRLKELREKKAKAANESFTELTDDIALEEVDAVAMLKKWTDDLKKINEDEKKFYDALDDQRNNINSSYNLQIKVLEHAIDEMKGTDIEKYIKTLENKRKLFESEKDNLLSEIEKARDLGKDKFSEDDMKKLNAKIVRFIKYLRSVEKFRHMAVTKSDDNPNNISLESVLDSKSGSKAIETLIACYDKDDVKPEELSRNIRDLRNDVNNNIDHDESDVDDWLKKDLDDDTKKKLEKEKQTIIDEKDKINTEFDNAIVADKEGTFDTKFKNAFIGKIKALCSVLSGIESKVRAIAQSFRGVKLGFESAVEKLFEDFDELEAFESNLVENEALYEEAFEAQIKVLEAVKNLIAKKKSEIKEEIQEIKEVKIEETESTDTNSESEEGTAKLDRYFEDAVHNIEAAIAAVNNKLETGERWAKAIKDTETQANIKKELTEITDDINIIESELNNYDFNNDSKTKSTKKSELLNLSSRAYSIVAKAEKWFVDICECMSSSNFEDKKVAVASYCLSYIENDSISLESLIDNPNYMTAILLTELDDYQNEEYVELAVEGFVSDVKNLLKSIRNKKSSVEKTINHTNSEYAEEDKDVIIRELLQYIKFFNSIEIKVQNVSKEDQECYDAIMECYDEFGSSINHLDLSKLQRVDIDELRSHLNKILSLYNRCERYIDKLASKDESLNKSKKALNRKAAVAAYCKSCLESYGIETDDLDMIDCGELMYEIVAHESKEIADSLLLEEAFEAQINILNKCIAGANSIGKTIDSLKDKIKDIGDKRELDKMRKTLVSYLKLIETYCKNIRNLNNVYKGFKLSQDIEKELVMYDNDHAIIKSMLDKISVELGDGMDIEAKKDALYEITRVAKSMVDNLDNMYNVIKDFCKKNCEKQKSKSGSANESLAVYCKAIIDRDYVEKVSSMESFSVDYYNHNYRDEITMEELMNSPELMNLIICTECYTISDSIDALHEALEASYLRNIKNNIRYNTMKASTAFKYNAHKLRVSITLLKLSMGKRINIEKLKESDDPKDYAVAMSACCTIYKNFNNTMKELYKLIEKYRNLKYLERSDMDFINDIFGTAMWYSGNTMNGNEIQELFALNYRDFYKDPEAKKKFLYLVNRIQNIIYTMDKEIDQMISETEKRIKIAEEKIPMIDEKIRQIKSANESISEYCDKIIKMYDESSDTFDPYEAAIEGFVDTMKTLATDLGAKTVNFVKEKATEIKNDPIGFFLNILRNFISWCESLLDKVKGLSVSKNVSTMIIKLCDTFIKDIEGFADGNHITKDSVKKFENIVDRIHKEYDKIADEIRKNKEAGNVLTDEEVLTVGEAAKYHKCIRAFIGKIKTIEKKLSDTNYTGTLYQDKLSPEAVEKYFVLYVQNVQAALIMMTSLMRSAYVSNKDRVFVGVPTFTEIDRSQLA